MKKLFFGALIAALLVPALQASPLGALQNARLKAQQTVSRSNLDGLFAAAVDYQRSNKKLPTLAELQVPPAALYKPYHALGGQQPQTPDKITDANCAYAYFGAAIGNITPQMVTGKVPLAFEKPGQRPDNKIMVLFASGKVEQLAIDAENCAGVIAKLKPEKADEAVWQKLAEAAKKIDEVK